MTYSSFVDGNTIHRLDPSHPSLTAFEVEYRWNGSLGQDITLGMYALFVLALLFALVLTVCVHNTYKREETTKSRVSSGTGISRRND